MERLKLGKASCRIALQRLTQRWFHLLHAAPRLPGHAGNGEGRGRGVPRFAASLSPSRRGSRWAGSIAVSWSAWSTPAGCGCRWSRVISLISSSKPIAASTWLLPSPGAISACAELLSGLLDEMTRLVALGFGVQGVRPNIENDHPRLIEHLVAGDADAAERVARRHVETFWEMTMEKVISSLRILGGSRPGRSRGSGEWGRELSVVRVDRVSKSSRAAMGHS